MEKSIYNEEGSLIPGGSKPIDLPAFSEPVQPDVSVSDTNQETAVVAPIEQTVKPEVGSDDYWNRKLSKIQSKFDISQYTDEEQKYLKSEGLDPQGKAFQNQVYYAVKDEPTYVAYRESLQSNDVGAIQVAYQNIKPQVIDIFRRIGTDLDKENKTEILSTHKRQMQEIVHNEQISSDEKLSQLRSMSSLFDSSQLDPKSVAEIKQVYGIANGAWMSDFEDKVKVFTTETERLRNQEYNPRVGKEYESRMQRINNAYQGIPGGVSSYINENDKRPIEVRIKESSDRLGQDLTKWKMRTYNGLLSSIRNVVFNGGSVDPKVYKQWQDVIHSLTEDDATNISNDGNLPEGTIQEKVAKDMASLVRTKKSSNTYSKKSAMFDANELMDLYIRNLEVGRGYK